MGGAEFLRVGFRNENLIKHGKKNIRTWFFLVTLLSICYHIGQFLGTGAEPGDVEVSFW